MHRKAESQKRLRKRKGKGGIRRARGPRVVKITAAQLGEEKKIETNGLKENKGELREARSTVQNGFELLRWAANK